MIETTLDRLTIAEALIRRPVARLTPARVDAGRQPHQSHLFTVRLWVEARGDGRTKWRGQVQHVLSGETHSFRERPTLLTLLRAMLPPAATDSAPDALNGARISSHEWLPGTIQVHLPTT